MSPRVAPHSHISPTSRLPDSFDCYAINDRQLDDEAEAAFKAFQNACDSSANELTKNEPRLASAYHSADEATRTADPFDGG